MKTREKLETKLWTLLHKHRLLSGGLIKEELLIWSLLESLDWRHPGIPPFGGSYGIPQSRDLTYYTPSQRLKA